MVIFYSGLLGDRFFAQQRAVGEATRGIPNQKRPDDLHQLADCIERKVKRVIEKDRAEYCEKVFGSEPRVSKVFQKFCAAIFKAKIERIKITSQLSCDLICGQGIHRGTQRRIRPPT
ncbi:uncharacterized protein Bfra_007594 [Botrytis fragariae]|uniref:Uncharacterized protein n=1 Tax=Botrytis fragariae TaxID=1964551 RepID=A0A8H6EG60_9HELO|nr:uncharacterized protein Bfra_007594 [Botrytis fragariae]KAF5871082.1 hypothetical protein Bfra_007594 [Botrytis fragariae]